jgi:pentose-5-phosphate-3-epimerase
VIAFMTVSEPIDAFVQIGTCVSVEMELSTRVHHFTRKVKEAGIQLICMG